MAGLLTALASLLVALLLVHPDLAVQEGLSGLVGEKMVQAAGLGSPGPVVDTSLEAVRHMDQGTEEKHLDRRDRQAHRDRQGSHQVDQTAALEMADIVRTEEKVAVAERFVVDAGAVDSEHFAMEDDQTIS